MLCLARDHYKGSNHVMNNFPELSNEELRMDEPMSGHTSWQVGGKAKRYFEPANETQLSNFLQRLDKDEAIFWLGLGSNVLIRDGGFDGTIISTTRMSNDMVNVDHCTIHVDAGVPCPKLARFSAKQGLEGAEFFAGIPGTVGGALAMNAGAFGGETWNIVDSVRTIDRKGDIHRRTHNDFDIAYRSVIHESEEWFLSAEFRLAQGNKAAAQDKIKSFLSKRRDSQPMGIASCGSVFRNPEGDYAARLIESCGLKGTTIGGACISEKHANFILNQGQATATDIESLIDLARSTVNQKFGIELIQEVKIIGQNTEQYNES